MKKATFLTFMLVALVLGVSQAQSTDLNDRAAVMTREMSAKLGLNESDYIQLKNVNREHLAKVEDINAAHKNDATTRDSKLAEAQTSYDRQLVSILNSKQMEAYASYKASKGNYTALESDKK